MVLSYTSGTVRVRSQRGYRTLIDGVSFEIADGETFALIGKTGSGKTMIALSIMQLLPDGVKRSGGATEFCGRDISRMKSLKNLLGKDIVYIPQSGGDYLNPTRRVKNQLYDNLKKMCVKGKDAHDAAVCVLEKAGFDDPERILDLYPFQLSGGMAQKVAIAIALCSDAKLLICDEATNGLNYGSTLVFIETLNSLFPEAAKLVITHDMRVARTCDRIGVLCDGILLETGDARSVFNAPRHPYTESLIGSLVENGMVQTPILRESRGSCPFYPRCKEACEKCLGDIPTRSDGPSSFRCVL